jgi:fructose-1,6-bisphosphatase/inositol monophosphatase family enzyme
VIDFKMNPWDIAPMQAIIPAAGGRLHRVLDEDEVTRLRVAIGENSRLSSVMITTVG